MIYGSGALASSPPPPHIRAVRASSQTSRAAGASRVVVSRADAPPVGAWKCIAGAGRGVRVGGGRLWA